MLISTIVLIPIPIEHVRAEDIYSAEESANYAEPIVLPVYDDSGESVVIDTVDGDTTDIDTTDGDTTYIDTTDDISYIDEDDTSDISDNEECNTDCNAGDDVSDSTHCEYCEEGKCVCEHDDALLCDNCGEEICICSDDHSTDHNTEPSDVCHKCGEPCGEECTEACKETCCTGPSGECECCKGECTCEGINRRSLLRAEEEPLFVTGVNDYTFLNNIVNGAVTTTQANNFKGFYTANEINTRIKAGRGVIVEISRSFNYSSTITVPLKSNITITSEKNAQGSPFTLTMTANFRHFTINTEGSLVLQNITLNSNPKLTSGTNVVRGGVDVLGGTLTAEEGAYIINCYNSRTNGTAGGGAVTVNRGLFILEGGTISGNIMNQTAAAGSRGGGGVYATNVGIFIMNSGYIENNQVIFPAGGSHTHTGGGGVYMGRLGKFALTGGFIRYNTAKPASGEENGGGGVFIAPGGDILMTGGTITENTAVDTGSSWQGGGGIFVAGGGEVIMHAGYIDNNRAGREGGGVFVGESGLFKLYGGEITNNWALSTSGQGGGGVMIKGGRFEADIWQGVIRDKLIKGNTSYSNGGGFTVVSGKLEIIERTEISGNKANPSADNNPENSVGGAILLNGGSTLNLYGGQIYNNFGGNDKGITWVNGNINLKGSPRVGNSDDTDAIFRCGSPAQNQVMTIVGPLGSDTYINVRDDAKDQGRTDYSKEFTVIATKGSGQGNATNDEASLFHYMGTGDPRETWSVIPHTHDEDPRLILGIPLTKFSLLHFPDPIHFGVRPLLTTDLVGPYGDAPGASDVEKDFTSGLDNWLYGFEVANTRHNNWYITLQATPFVNNDGIIGAIPLALKNGEDNQAPEDLTSASLQIFTSDAKGESIKWHWTQMDYKIEAQTALDTVIKGDFQSVFTWELHDVPKE